MPPVRQHARWQTVNDSRASVRMVTNVQAIKQSRQQEFAAEKDQHDHRGGRYVQFERIKYTLLFTSPGGQVVQLDYSIPTAAYQAEGQKVRSSIGTLSSLDR